MELDGCRPPPYRRCALVYVLGHIKRIKCLSVSLQKKSLVHSVTYYGLDEVGRDYRFVKYYIGQHATIVRDKLFEMADYGILSGQESDVSKHEGNIVKASKK